MPTPVNINGKFAFMLVNKEGDNNNTRMGVMKDVSVDSTVSTEFCMMCPVAPNFNPVKNKFKCILSKNDCNASQETSVVPVSSSFNTLFLDGKQNNCPSVCEEVSFNNESVSTHTNTNQINLDEEKVQDITTKHNTYLKSSKKMPLLEFKCTTCEKTFNSKLRLSIHKKSHLGKVTELVECNTKNQPFVPKVRLDTQLPNNNLYCVSCGKCFKSLSGFRAHERLHKAKTQPKKHMCHVCGKGFYLPSGLKKHLASHNEIKEYICEICGMAFSRHYYLTRHLTVHSDVRPYVCDLCGVCFKRRNYLNTHLEGVHNFQISRPIPPCEICGKTFIWKRIKVEHMRLHTGERPLKCSFCNKSFRTQQCKSTHEKNIHSDHPIQMTKPIASKKTEFEKDSWKCNVCEKVFHTKGYLYQHNIRFHKDDIDVSKESLFACNSCGKTYSSKQGLYQHNRYFHVADKNVSMESLSCDSCGKTFSSKLGLYQHNRNVHLADKNVTYPCKLCDKTFKKKANIYAHLRSHSEDRPYSCPVCKKSFKTSSALSLHKATHTDVKPFPCSFCEKRFRRKCLLEVHTRSHTGEKPYSCEICNKVFSQLGDRNRHSIKTHAISAVKPVKTTCSLST